MATSIDQLLGRSIGYMTDVEMRFHSDIVPTL